MLTTSTSGSARPRWRPLNDDDYWLLGKVIEGSVGGARAVSLVRLRAATRDGRFGPDARLGRGIEESLDQLKRRKLVGIHGGQIFATDESIPTWLGRFDKTLEARTTPEMALAAVLTWTGSAAVTDDLTRASIFAGGAAVAAVLGEAAAGLRKRRNGTRASPLDAISEDARLMGRAFVDLDSTNPAIGLDAVTSRVRELAGCSWSAARRERALGQLVLAGVVEDAFVSERGLPKFQLTDSGRRLAQSRKPTRPSAPRVPNKQPPSGLLGRFVDSSFTLSPMAQAVLYVASDIQEQSGNAVSAEQIDSGLSANWHALAELTGVELSSAPDTDMFKAANELFASGLAERHEGALRVTDAGFSLSGALREAHDRLTRGPLLTF
jgi:hypothetical protein